MSYHKANTTQGVTNLGRKSNTVRALRNPLMCLLTLTPPRSPKMTVILTFMVITSPLFLTVLSLY